MFKKILIANRGEIALRIMRSCKELNIKTVAVYSDADRLSPHVLYADQSAYIGASPSNSSYLQIQKIIEVCKMLDVDAVHPGYGFLSENADFASEIEKNGITFIGPSIESIEIMGNKLAAKNAVQKYNIPLVPGTDKPITDISEAKKIANDIGYPILIKASAGGGGKGMRIVKEEQEFEEQMTRAKSEAKNSFNDDSCFIEKYIESPRHIEVQILADKYGNCIHIFERECSIQRRHQKVIEEAPSIVVNEELRKKLGNAAINVAKSCNYYNAGTVEFIMDENLNFYFLEMNTRLQVEHPITEMISGLDLVKEQIKIAFGECLTIKQEDLIIKGHAIELRIYAEDPKNNFLPDIGTLTNYIKPEGLGIRVDDGFRKDMEIPIYYDPMIAKLVVHGQNRNEAIEKMKRAIYEYKIEGVKTTLEFGKFVMNNQKFKMGEIDTHFVDKHYVNNDFSEEFEEDQKKLLLDFVAYIYSKKNNINNNNTIKNINIKNQNWKKNRIN